MLYLLIYLAIGAAGALALWIMGERAPLGWEDSDGWHAGEPDASESFHSNQIV